MKLFRTISAAVLVAFAVSACAPVPSTPDSPQVSSNAPTGRQGQQCFSVNTDGLTLTAPTGETRFQPTDLNAVVHPAGHTIWFAGGKHTCGSHVEQAAGGMSVGFLTCVVPTDEPMMGTMVVVIGVGDNGYSAVQLRSGTHPEIQIKGEGTRIGAARCPG